MTHVNQSMDEISLLQKREIQAPVAACIIREFARVMGQDAALKVATAAIQKDAMAAGKKIADQYGSNTMVDLARVVKEIWAENEAITIQVIEETEQKLSFDVIRCRYAEFYQKANLFELGVCLSCCRDEAFARGFNPRIHLLRTQTIMQGESICDFRFVLE